MKKVLLVILAIGILTVSGCGKKAVKNPAASPTPAPSSNSAQQQQQSKKLPPPTKQELNSVEDLTKQLDNTKDPKERRKILDKLQVILDKVEAQSNNKNK